jgi:hypothetical protein
MGRGKGSKDRNAEYVFDTSAFHEFGHYYLPTFQPIWDMLDEYVEDGRIRSVKQVREELEARDRSRHLSSWVAAHGTCFRAPSEGELNFLRDIFAIRHFQQLVSKQARLLNGPVADPFVIAAARNDGAYLVTQEVYKKNGAKIPNVCEKFEIECIDIEAFFKREKWHLVKL